MITLVNYYLTLDFQQLTKYNRGWLIKHFYKFQMYCSVSPLPSVHHFHRFLFHRVLHEIYLALTAIQLRVDSMVISSASCSVQCRPSALNSNMVAVTSILAIGQPISAHRITNHCDVSTTRKWLSIRSVFWPTIGVNAAKTMLKEVKCAWIKFGWGF